MPAPLTAAAVAATLAFSATVSSARAKRLCDTPLASSWQLASLQQAALQPAPHIIEAAIAVPAFPQSQHTEEAA
ncbi:MAG: hypothetical protein ABW178_00655 [Pseudoxanthomonas sp.]